MMLVDGFFFFVGMEGEDGNGGYKWRECSRPSPTAQAKRARADILVRTILFSTIFYRIVLKIIRTYSLYDLTTLSPTVANAG